MRRRQVRQFNVRNESERRSRFPARFSRRGFGRGVFLETRAAADSQSGVDVCNYRGVSVFYFRKFAPMFLQGNARVSIE